MSGFACAGGCGQPTYGPWTCDVCELTRLRARVAELERWAKTWKNAARVFKHEWGFVVGQRDGWEESAAQHGGNADFYRGIVERIGQPFGVAARTSDDGSIQEDVLALKVPELVADLRRQRDTAVGALRKARAALQQLLQYAAGHGVTCRCTVCRCRDIADRALADVDAAAAKGEP